MNIKKRNQFKIILSGVFITIVVLGIYYLTSQKKSIVPRFFSGEEKTHSINITVETTPSNAFVSMDHNAARQSPVTINNVVSGQHTISAELNGFFTIEKVVTIDPSMKDDLTIKLKLEEMPRSIQSVSDRATMYASPVDISSTEDYIVFLNPYPRQLVVKKDKQDFGLFPEQLNFIEKIYWLNNNKAIITNGALYPDKVSYIADFSPWNRASKPTLTKLPQTGVAFSQGPSEEKVAFFGKIDFSKGSGSVGLLNLNTKDMEYLPDLGLIGVRDIFWAKDTLMYIVSGPVHGNTQEENYNERVIYKVQKDVKGWTAEKLNESLPRVYDFNVTTETLAFINNSIMHVINFKTNKEMNYDVAAKDAKETLSSFPVLVYNEDLILYSYLTNANKVKLNYINMHSGDRGSFTLNETLLGEPTELKRIRLNTISITTNRDRYYIYELNQEI